MSSGGSIALIFFDSECSTRGSGKSMAVMGIHWGRGGIQLDNVVGVVYAASSAQS